MWQRLKNWLFNQRQWDEISGMTDSELRWEFNRLLYESEKGRYDCERFRRVCYRMALRFYQQDGATT